MCSRVGSRAQSNTWECSLGLPCGAVPWRKKADLGKNHCGVFAALKVYGNSWSQCHRSVKCINQKEMQAVFGLKKWLCCEGFFTLNSCFGSWCFIVPFKACRVLQKALPTLNAKEKAWEWNQGHVLSQTKAACRYFQLFKNFFTEWKVDVRLCL